MLIPDSGFLHLMICRSSRARYWRAGTVTILLATGMGARRPALGAVVPLAGTAQTPVGTHPVHVSSTQIELSGDERRLNVTVRLFTDDLEDALRAFGHPVAIATSPVAAVDSALSAFLRAHLSLSLDGRPPTSGRVTGHRQDPEATTVTFEVPLRTVPGTIAVVQRVFFDRFDDQVNLIHLRFGSKKRSALLRGGLARAEFTL